MSKTFIYLLQNEYLCRRMMESENITSDDVWNLESRPFEISFKISDIISRNPKTSSATKSVYNYFHSYVYHTREDPQFKYQILKQVVGNIFIAPEMKEEFIRIFCIVQRSYRGFARLAHVYRCKRAPVRVAHDLYLSPLTEDSNHVLCLLIEGHKYLFHLNNLVSFFHNSLTSMEYFISSPVSVKNPYTNSHFTLAALYSMYFFIRRHVCHVPEIIHAFFSLEFNLSHFSSMYKDVVQDIALSTYVKNADDASLSVAATTMIGDYYEHNDIHIHPSIPRDIFVRAFRPYLKLYYKSKYSLSGELNRRYGRQLRAKLSCFFHHNPRFGTLISEEDGCRIYNLYYKSSADMMERTQLMHAYTRQHTTTRDGELDQTIYSSSIPTPWYPGNRGRMRRGRIVTPAIESDTSESEETDEDIDVLTRHLEDAAMEMALDDHDTSSSENNGSEEGEGSRGTDSVRI